MHFQPFRKEPAGQLVQKAGTPSQVEHDLSQAKQLPVDEEEARTYPLAQVLHATSVVHILQPYPH